LIVDETPELREVSPRAVMLTVAGATIDTEVSP